MQRPLGLHLAIQAAHLEQCHFSNTLKYIMKSKCLHNPFGKPNRFVAHCIHLIGQASFNGQIQICLPRIL